MAQLVDFLLRGLFFVQMLHKLVNGVVIDQGTGGDARLQHKTFQRGAAAEGYVNLPMGKSLSRINDDLVESQSLALVDGDSPSQTQRNLLETADFLLFNILIFSIDGVFYVLPSELGNDDIFLAAFYGDRAFFFVIAD